MSRFQPKNMLVTGGAGFIGSNFVHRVLASRPEVAVTTLDLLTYAGSLDNLQGTPTAPRHTFVHGDVCDRPLVESLLREHRIDTVVHFAAESHVDRSISGPDAFLRTNVTGTWTLLEACRSAWQERFGLGKGGLNGLCRFHHISTDEVYGSLGADDPAFTEHTPYAPNSPYSASKAASDHFVRAWHHTFGLPVTTSNCSNNFGPRQHAEKLIPTVIRHCIEGLPIPVYGSGLNVRDWLYVDDHCDAILRVIEDGQPGETYNIGGENEQRNIDLVEGICRLMDALLPHAAPHARLVTHVTDRPGHDWRYAIDISRVRGELAWQPATPFGLALERTIDWYLARPPAGEPGPA